MANLSALQRNLPHSRSTTPSTSGSAQYTALSPLKVLSWLRMTPTAEEKRLSGQVPNIATDTPVASLEHLSPMEHARVAHAVGRAPVLTSAPPAVDDLLSELSPPKYERFALRGDVMVRDNAGELILRKNQYVTIAGDKILSVSGEPPEEGVHVVETDGTIMPGLIDLHDHLRYAYSPRFAESIFAEERARFANRYEWQLRETYLDFKEHHKHHMPRDNPEAQVAFELYGEMRELVGGTTSVADQVSEEAQKALARNVYGSKDVNGLGQNLAYEVYAIDPSGLQDSPPRFEMKASFLERVQDADVVYLHLAEGKKGDAITRGEFEAFMTWAEANPELAKKIVPIHVTGLESEDFRRLERCRYRFRYLVSLQQHGAVRGNHGRSSGPRAGIQDRPWDGLVPLRQRQSIR